MKPPKLDELDEEIRGHIALSIQERIARGEDPEAARLAAIKEFGNVLLTRESIERVWRPRWLDGVEALGRDIRFALRSLMRAKGRGLAVQRRNGAVAAHILEHGGPTVNHEFIPLRQFLCRGQPWRQRFSKKLAPPTERMDGFRTVDLRVRRPSPAQTVIAQRPPSTRRFCPVM